MPGQIGNSGGKKGRSGRKPRAFEDDLQVLLRKCFTKADREKVLRQLVEDSFSPSFRIRHAARTLLLAYLYGKPVDRVELSGEGGGPIIPITIIEAVSPKVTRE